MEINVFIKIIESDEVGNYEISTSTVVHSTDSIERFIQAVVETFCKKADSEKYNLLNVNGVLMICKVEGSSEDITALEHDSKEFRRLCNVVMRSLAGAIRTTCRYLSNKLLCCAEKGTY